MFIALDIVTVLDFLHRGKIIPTGKITCVFFIALGKAKSSKFYTRHSPFSRDLAEIQ